MNSAHHVVRRRSDFHRFLGNIDIRELFELVIHARQLSFDVLSRVRKPGFDPGDVEKHAAVRTPPPFLDLAHDAARNVIASQ